MYKMGLYKQWQTALGIDASEQEYNLEALINLAGHYTNNSAGAIDKTAAIQTEIETMPGYGTTLVGFWLPGYDMVENEGAANNQVVKDWSGLNNHGLRGNSATLNTSSPTGTSFNGNQFIQVPYAANMHATSSDSMALGSVAAQSVAASVYTVSQNGSRRAIYYVSDGRVYGYFGRYAQSINNRALNTLENYMIVGSDYNVNIYKNGLYDSGGWGGGSYNPDVIGQPLYIGRRVSGQYFTGDIHCVYMYVNSNQGTNAVAIDTAVNNILTILEGGQ